LPHRILLLRRKRPNNFSEAFGCHCVSPTAVYRAGRRARQFESTTEIARRHVQLIETASAFCEKSLAPQRGFELHVGLESGSQATLLLTSSEGSANRKLARVVGSQAHMTAAPEAEPVPGRGTARAGEEIPLHAPTAWAAPAPSCCYPRRRLRR
jgi:hypothetical protein